MLLSLAPICEGSIVRLSYCISRFKLSSQPIKKAIEAFAVRFIVRAPVLSDCVPEVLEVFNG